MNTLVKGFKTLFKKIEAAKRPQTKQKYQDELKRKMKTSLEKAWNADLLLQQKRQYKRDDREQKRLQKQLCRVKETEEIGEGKKNARCQVQEIEEGGRA